VHDGVYTYAKEGKGCAELEIEGWMSDDRS